MITIVEAVRNYFVDEAGDSTLFDGKGRAIIGTPGCSKYFILGYLDVADPAGLHSALATLRAALLADPYFRRVPSMRPEAEKTAIAFHAKDDVPEVRRQVFSLLLEQDVRFFAVVKDKCDCLAYVRQRNGREPGYRYTPNELYDFLVRNLFTDKLHKEAAYQMTFARRGKSDRTVALNLALDVARSRFARRWGITNTAAITVRPSSLLDHGGLQAVDYFLWALQRLYERGEDRYVEYLWPRFRLVRDLDDTRIHPYGEYYTQRKPLNTAALRTAPEI